MGLSWIAVSVLYSATMAKRTKTNTTKTSTKERSTRKSALAEHLAARQKALRKVMKKRGFDGMLVSNPPDIRYLSGYLGHDAYLLITSRRAIFFSDFRYEEDLEPFRKWAKVVMRKLSLAHDAGAAANDLCLRRVALQAEYLKVPERAAIAKAIGKSKVRDTSSILTGLRTIKDAIEVRTIRKAVKIAQDALAATIKRLKSGQTERAICAWLEYEMKMAGAEGPGFAPIIAAQANGSRPHYSPSEKVKLVRRQPLLVDWGACVDGYTSDLTRTFGFGGMPAKVQEIYEIVLESQLAAIAVIKPGVELRAVDSAARSVIEKAGYGDRFGHGLGHGIGLDVHEAPGMSFRSKKGAVLEAGMIVTVEPGIYLPGIGGVRIEDDVLVTEGGRSVLSNYPKTLKSAIL